MLATTRRDDSHAGLRLIAAFKLLKAALLVVVALGALRLVHRDVAEIVGRWAEELRMDPQSRVLHALLSRLSGVDDHVLRRLSAASFFYAALLATEGVGLWLEKRWAEYMTLVLTASFLPIEIFELTRRLTGTRMTILAINVAILVYLVRLVRAPRPSPRASTARLEIDAAT